MLPFIGYNIKDYINHWESMTLKTTEDLLPKIFYVNWFRKSNNNFLWPGFGDNVRVLKWILERTNNKSNYIKTAIGYLPDKNQFDLDDLNINEESMEELLKVDHDIWLDEVKSIENYYNDLYGDSLPKLLRDQLHQLKTRLKQ